MDMIAQAYSFGLGDGPTEVHKVTVAREVLGNYRPSPGPFPTAHLPAASAAAEARYADVLARHSGA